MDVHSCCKLVQHSSKQQKELNSGKQKCSKWEVWRHKTEGFRQEKKTAKQVQKRKGVEEIEPGLRCFDVVDQFELLWQLYVWLERLRFNSEDIVFTLFSLNKIPEAPSNFFRWVFKVDSRNLYRLRSLQEFTIASWILRTTGWKITVFKSKKLQVTRT